MNKSNFEDNKFGMKIALKLMKWYQIFTNFRGTAPRPHAIPGGWGEVLRSPGKSVLSLQYDQQAVTVYNLNLAKIFPNSSLEEITKTNILSVIEHNIQYNR